MMAVDGTCREMIAASNGALSARRAPSPTTGRSPTSIKAPAAGQGRSSEIETTLAFSWTYRLGEQAPDPRCAANHFIVGAAVDRDHDGRRQCNVHHHAVLARAVHGGELGHRHAPFGGGE